MQGFFLPVFFVIFNLIRAYQHKATIIASTEAVVCHPSAIKTSAREKLHTLAMLH
jgi:hypothetical protein